MIKGTVTYVDGISVGVLVEGQDDVETVVGINRPNTKIETVEHKDGKRGDPKDARPGHLSGVQPGDYVEVRGANPLRADSVRVFKGTTEDALAIREFNNRKAAAARPTPVNVTAAKAADAPKSLPAERLTTADEAPVDVPYGQRRKWRAAQAKEAGQSADSELAQQTPDDEDQSEHPSHAELKGMTKAELEDQAKKEGVDLSGATTKDEYLGKFTAHHRAQTRARNRGQ